MNETTSLNETPVNEDVKLSVANINNNEAEANPSYASATAKEKLPLAISARLPTRRQNYVQLFKASLKEEILFST